MSTGGVLESGTGTRMASGGRDRDRTEVEGVGGEWGARGASLGGWGASLCPLQALNTTEESCHGGIPRVVHVLGGTRALTRSH